MPGIRHLLGILVCAIAVAAFQCYAILCSIADLHPGGDVVVPPEVRAQADLWSAISRPFVDPVLWIASKIGGYASWLLIVQWFVIPFAYGAVLYLPLGYFIQRRRRAHI
jgi:hypothetical protein